MGNFFVNKKPQVLLRLGLQLRLGGTWIERFWPCELQVLQPRLRDSVLLPLRDGLNGHLAKRCRFCWSAKSPDDFCSVHVASQVDFKRIVS